MVSLLELSLVGVFLRGFIWHLMVPSVCHYCILTPVLWEHTQHLRVMPAVRSNTNAPLALLGLPSDSGSEYTAL